MMNHKFSQQHEDAQFLVEWAEAIGTMLYQTPSGQIFCVVSDEDGENPKWHRVGVSIEASAQHVRDQITKAKKEA